MSRKTAIVWFRQDLRLHDNPALSQAVADGYDILPVFIYDQENAGEWPKGEASRWWLFKSLQSLNESMCGHMVFRAGKADEILPALAKEAGAQAVYWNRCYEPWRVTRDKKIKEQLKDDGISVESFNGSLLWEPWEVLKDDGTPYRVFTPFYRKGCLKRKEPAAPLDKPDKISYADFHGRHNENDLDILPQIQWYRKLDQHWEVSEDGAFKRLKHFLENGLNGYKELRNRPDLDHVSMMSPYLHFGNISPRAVWQSALQHGLSHGWEKDTDHFCSELGWREFSYSLLYHFPDLPRKPLQEKFAAFPWAQDDGGLLRWQKGLTGIPLVDAGMRQLWDTGWMHNRVRMVVASFLIKNQLLHWHDGEDWFWDCLVDADLANNAASWQWVAGCGADAAPYFRIFNPITQGEKFDPNGDYIRKYVPELRDVPNQYIHKPWNAPKELCPDYPDPIVDIKQTRQRALDAYQEIR